MVTIHVFRVSEDYVYCTNITYPISPGAALAAVRQSHVHSSKYLREQGHAGFNLSPTVLKLPRQGLRSDFGPLHLRIDFGLAARVTLHR